MYVCAYVYRPRCAAGPPGVRRAGARGTLLYSYSTLLCSTLLYSTLLCSTLLYDTIRYDTLTLLYSTMPYYTITILYEHCARGRSQRPEPRAPAAERASPPPRRAALEILPKRQ